MRIAIALVLVLLLAGVAMMVMSGSSVPTSRAQAQTVAAAENRFLDEWGQASRLGRVWCEGLPDEAWRRCLGRVESPLQGSAVQRFTASIEAVLGEGVGPECSKALEGTQSDVLDVPYLPGDAPTVCRRESRA